ncbi:MAG: ABC transporter ATP-binding protein [Pseudomonadota bacterium]
MQNVIELSDLKFGWPGEGTPVVDIDELTLAQSEKLFVSGASGSGKTTLLSLVAGIHPASSGRARVLNVDLGTFSNAQRDQFRADHIGFVFQQFNLIPYLSVRRNVLLPLRFSNHRKQRCGTPDRDAEELLKHLGLEGDILDAKPTALSVGQQQRVAAARALIGKPDIVIADEPTSSLDTDNRGQFIELLMRECDDNGSALLFVSHDTGLAQYFDRRVDMVDINRSLASAT